MTLANLLAGRWLAALLVVLLTRWLAELISGRDYFPGSLLTAAVIAAVLLLGFQIAKPVRRA